MSAAVPPTPGDASQTRLLMRVAGILAIVGGVTGIVLLALELVNFGSVGLGLFALFISGLLSVAGGILAVRGSVQLAPWLILGALILGAPILALRYWAILALGGDFGDMVDVERALSLFRFLSLLRTLSMLLIVIAFVLALVAFVKAPGKPKDVTVAVGVTAGLAVPNADGSIPEGWYADPDGKPSERFWDGLKWTDKSRPRTSATAAAMLPGATQPTVTATGAPISPKSRAAAAILCWFLGVIGIHRFYVGKVGTGVAQIFTLGGLGIWVLVDFIMILVGSFKDSEEKVLINW